MAKFGRDVVTSISKRGVLSAMPDDFGVVFKVYFVVCCESCLSGDRFLPIRLSYFQRLTSYATTESNHQELRQRSTSAAAARTRSSSSRRPMICTPMGVP